MLIRGFLSYFLTRGLTGIINFLAIALYTRALSTSDYGEYALIVATVGFINALLFQWIRLVILRFLPKYKKEGKEFLLLGTLFTTYLVILLGITLISIVVLLTEIVPVHLVLCIVLLIISQSIFETILELLRSLLYSRIYGILSVSKATISLLVALFLIKMGFGSFGIVIGLLLGSSLPIIALYVLLKKQERLYELKQLWNFNYSLLKELLSYGLPLTSTLLLSFIMNQSDRLLISWMIGKSEVGVYSVAYDLTQQTIIMLMMVVNLAAYPLCIRALENGGIESAQRQVRESAVALLLIAFPATVGIIALSNSISSSVLGRDFSAGVADIMPIVATSVLIQGMKSYYFDLSFQLGKKTVLQIWPVLFGSIVNIILNLVLIPLYKSEGAVLATLVSYIIAIVLSWKLGKKLFPLVFPFKEFIKIFVSSMVMMVSLSFWDSDNETFYGLVLKVCLGVGIYFVTIYIFDVWKIRNRIKSFLAQTREK
ncbi:lipopolysaccharide biosynthesis protein [Geobacillus stearothermophilus]|uniref:lipopolysaccharide biosynthesis protein n=1 Tax=Geobacillus stearothermophilus TaxID=1422 RepID=UPI003D20D9BB